MQKMTNPTLKDKKLTSEKLKDAVKKANKQIRLEAGIEEKPIHDSLTSKRQIRVEAPVNSV